MNKNVIFIIAQKNFRDEELFESKKALEDHGFETAIAAKVKDAAIGKLGAEVSPDLSLAEVKAKNFAAVVFVGGSGALVYFDDPQALQLARDFQKAQKVIGAICSAPSILANAGLLIGKTVTAHPSQEQNLRNRGANYTGMPVEVDGLIVTASGPAAAREFGNQLALLLETQI